MLDSTQVVSGIAILLSFLAGYRYGVRNLDEQTKTTEKNSTENERVIFSSSAEQHVAETNNFGIDKLMK